MKKILSKSIVLAKNVSRIKYQKHIRRTNNWFIICILFIALFSYITNPFTRFSIITNPFTLTQTYNQEIDIKYKGKIYLHDYFLMNVLGLLKSSWHIFINSMTGGGPASKQTTIDGIINDIHALRFNPQEPYLISGDHFSVFYPRSLGIFYHTLLDPRTAHSEENWQKRQKIYTQSLLYMLEAYKNASRLSTTITPIGPKSVTLNNFFDPPSDTMYSILYAIKSLRTTEELLNTYSVPHYAPTVKLSTEEISKKILFSYQESLK
ncbi:MAG: hypothetical protein N3A54_07245, partial [Patescibacteria group bacterium]|nr:hypothetical protein [Patescibacteria group bacterium]